MDLKGNAAQPRRLLGEEQAGQRSDVLPGEEQIQLEPGKNVVMKA